MKRRLVRWFVMVALALGMALPVGLASAAPPTRPVYLALGDSLALGVGATVPERVGYVPRFHHALQPAKRGGPHALINLAVPGATSASFITNGQLASAVAAINDPTTDVQVVTLDIGGNDLLALLQGHVPALPLPCPACRPWRRP